MKYIYKEETHTEWTDCVFNKEEMRTGQQEFVTTLQRLRSYFVFIQREMRKNEKREIDMYFV